MRIDFKSMYRVTVFIPAEYRSRMLAAVQEIVPLGDEHYDLVHWSVENVTERFRPLPGARPSRGEIGQLHAEEGEFLVFLLPQDEQQLDHVLQRAVFATHPWEAPGVTVEKVLLPLKQEE